jgi:iron(III) transport system substrate-binding protein
VGVSGRARVIVYNTEKVQAADLPASILDFTDPKWKGRLGWAPTNGSFQAFVTALRELRGEDEARAWLEGVKANEPTVYESNDAIVAAVIAGDIDAGFVNHYYLLAARSEAGSDVPAENHFFAGGDPGSLVNVAGAGILTSAPNPAGAQAFVDFLLSENAQRYFAEETYEYPLIEGVPVDERLTPLEDIESPDLDLSDLADLEGTLRLLQETGVL